MSLDEYKRKRDLSKTPEPSVDKEIPGPALRFVVQKHAASRLHYDFRLELDGVLKSWAIPKGPSLDPAVKRLAVMVEDHPYEYRTFEGVIPGGNYGAGEVLIWDEGSYHAVTTTDRRESEEILRKGLAKGDLKFVLDGHKLQGEFALVRIRSEKDNNWLLLKKKAPFASAEEVTRQERSVVSGVTLEELKGVPPGSGPRDRDTAAAPEPPQSRGKVAGNDPPIKAPSAPMPHGVRPMLANTVTEPFDDPDWIFEIKQDGYRCLAEIEGGQVALHSRNDISFNLKFVDIAKALATIDRDAVLDGEVVALDAEGRSSFQLLQNWLKSGQGNLFFFVFDLLYLDGRDLRALPLIARKQMLKDLLPELPNVRYNDHVVEYGKDFFQLAKEHNLEGIMAKNGASRYQAGKRSGDWQKLKIRREQEAVICGYTGPRGSRRHFGSLVLGVHERGELVYVGLAGGGFDDVGLKEMNALLLPLVQAASPFKKRIPTDMPVTWVRPAVVCEVAFAEWTDEGVMRQPVFCGLREDKDPMEVVRESYSTEVLPESVPEAPQSGEAPLPEPQPVKGKLENKVLVIGGKRLGLTNLDKIFWPEERYAKGDVVDYYRRVAAGMLPHLKDRPESLYRTPDGITKEGFFQKEAGELPPHWVKTAEIFSRHVERKIRYFVCQDEATLVYLANLGCVEINPWLSRLQSLDYPDYFVIDLDPEDIPFDKVIKTALGVREVLEQAGITGYPKTSGASGMHIYVPLGARYDYDTAERFAHLVATLVHQRLPGITSLVRSPRRRQKKVYLDYLQNKPGQTVAAPYSIRPRPGATVSAPLNWEEVKAGLEPGQFTISTMPGRLERLGDLFAGVLGPGVDLESCIERLES